MGRDIGNVDDQGKLVYKFVLGARTGRRQATKQVYHPASNTSVNPYVAVNDPYYIALRLAVAPAHVPDLGIRSEILDLAIAPRKIRILIFNQDFGIKC